MDCTATLQVTPEITREITLPVTQNITRTTMLQVTSPILSLLTTRLYSDHFVY
jgi:hypothetical protein